MEIIIYGLAVIGGLTVACFLGLVWLFWQARPREPRVLREAREIVNRQGVRRARRE